MEAPVSTKRASRVRASEITPKELYFNRREFLLSAGAGAVGALAGALTMGVDLAAAGDTLAIAKRVVTTTDPPSPLQTITTFNNFYEFGTDKSDPAKNSKNFKPRPWSVAVDGACGKPGSYTLEDILKPHPLEERVYRHRCVEGWSIVVPWVGFPLGDLLKRFEPAGTAKFVEFTTVQRPEEMPGQRRWFGSPIGWPYKEGLRIDEAMHPLAIIAVGLYGEALPNQNGAPLRLVVPWKYGFKSIKSIVKIQFTDKQPKTSWQIAAPDYYGFYSNVNPGLTSSTFRDQSTERRLGEFFMRKTLPFNGYSDQVASLYTGLDLRRNF
jgi:methionine sulfoxide reductase catalytic subunit